MKKPLILFIALMFITSVCIGQIDMGVRFQTGHMQLTPVSTHLISNQKSIDYRFEVVGVTSSQSIGLYSQFNFGSLYFQPEILYSSYAVQYDVMSYNGETGPSSNTFIETRKQVEIPINAGLRINNFRIGGGPIFRVLSQYDSSLNDLNNISINQRSLNTGFQAGLGYDFRYFHVDVKYQREFSRVTDHLSYDQSPIKLNSHTNSLQLGIAIAIDPKSSN